MNNYLKYFGIAFLVIALDQATKMWVHFQMDFGSPGQIQIFGDWFKLHYTTNPGMADAIYFMENAKNMKTAYDILANSVMSRVVLGALGLPIEIAIQPIETQARAITTRMNLADLQKADKVNAFAERFLMAEATAAIAAASVPQDPFAMITSLSIRV